MDPRTIFVKTAKGIGEIKNKTNHLPGKVRRILILVDGRSSAAEIGAKISNLSESKRREAFEKLLNEGFVRESGIADGDGEDLEDDPMLTATTVARLTDEGDDDDGDDEATTEAPASEAVADDSASKAREQEEVRRAQIAAHADRLRKLRLASADDPITSSTPKAPCRPKA